MNTDQWTAGHNSALRVVILVAAALVVCNVVADVLFDRDRALALDDLLVTIAALGLAAIVELAVFRPRRSR